MRASDHDPAFERGWIAQWRQTRLGRIFCGQQGMETAKLRVFMLEPKVRGHGLGKRLRDTCPAFAKEAGDRRMQLWTHESHRAACALYARAGFTLKGSEPVHSFGCDLVAQTWNKALQSLLQSEIRMRYKPWCVPP